MGSFGNGGHDEEFFVYGNVLLDGVDADGEAAAGASERPLVGNFEAAGVAVIGIVHLCGIAAKRRLGVADQTEKESRLLVEEQTERRSGCTLRGNQKSGVAVDGFAREDFELLIEFAEAGREINLRVNAGWTPRGVVSQPAWPLKAVMLSPKDG